MRNELARAEVLRLQRIEGFRHDPLGFVERSNADFDFDA